MSKAAGTLIEKTFGDWNREWREGKPVRAAGTITLGESAGHPFRGNQWKDGEGEDKAAAEKALTDKYIAISDKFNKNPQPGISATGTRNAEKIDKWFGTEFLHSDELNQARIDAKIEINNNLSAGLVRQAADNPDLHTALENFANEPNGKYTRYEEESYRQQIADWKADGTLSQYYDVPFINQVARDEIDLAVSAMNLTPLEVGARVAAQDLVDRWASTAADHDASARAIQDVVARELGATAAQWETFKENEPQPAWAGPQMPVIAHDEIVSAFVHETYNQTQSALREMGIKEDEHVTLYRGMNLSDYLEGEHPMDFNPASSWTTDWSTATMFAQGDPFTGGDHTAGNRLVMSVMAKDIYSTARTGPGCLGESEVLVLNRPDYVAQFVSKGQGPPPNAPSGME